jgi:hypothetical protein
MGCNIKVVVTLNDTFSYEGTITATTKDAVPSGYKITGKISSYNAANEITYVLYAWDEAADDYSTTPVNGHGSIVDGAVVGVQLKTSTPETTIGQQQQTFEIENVPDGRYKLVLIKIAHLTYTVKNIVVNGEDINLTDETYPEDVKLMSMAPGDVTGEGDINSDDTDTIANPDYYRKATTDVTEEQKIYDVNGDGDINSDDLDLVANPDYYRKNNDDFVFTIPYTVA